MANKQADDETSSGSVEPERNELSDREIEILRLLATGVSNKEIAQKLFISPNTVKVHLRNIFAKTGAASRTEATLFAIRAGLVVVDTPTSPTQPGSPEAVTTTALETLPTSISPPPVAGPVPLSLRPAFSIRWVIAGVLGLVLLASPFIWRVLTVVSATPTVQANTPSPSQAPPRWQTNADIPIPRRAFAVATYNNQIYAIGGETAEAITDEVSRYDSVTNQWETLRPKPMAVADTSAAIVGGQVYVPGGRLASGMVTSTVEVYDPARNIWEQRAPLPFALSAYALAAFEGRLYLFGGWDGATYRAEVFVYDPGQDAWTTLTPMPTARGQAGVAVASGRIFVIGGTDGVQPLVQNEAFDPNTATWQAQAPLPVGRASMGMTTIADNIYLIGGEGEVGPSLTLQYSPTQNEWQAFEAPPNVTQWIQPGLAALNGQSLYAFGGQQDGQLTTQALNYQVLYYIVIPIIK